MSYTSLADFVEELERLGQLRLVEVGVDLAGEVAALSEAVARSAGPALLFRNIRGNAIPLVFVYTCF